MPCFMAKYFPFFFRLELKRLRFAYGVTSNVPNSGLHYLLFDCDTKPDFDYFIQRYKEPIVMYPSAHGWHVIVFQACSFSEAISKMAHCPFADKNHLAIGIKRGYWFLETYVPLFFKELKYMRIERT